MAAATKFFPMPEIPQIYNLISSLRSRDFNVDDDDERSVRKNQCVHFLQLNYILCMKYRKKVHEGQLVDFVASPSSSSDEVNLGKTMLHFIAHDVEASGRLWYFDMTILSPTCCQ